MPRPMPKQSRRSGFTHTVEFAVVAPVLFGLVLGIFEVGRYIMIQNLLMNAARAGVRVGVVAGVSSATITTTVSNVLTSQGVSGDTATILVNENAVDASTATSGQEITVKVSVPVSNISWVPYPTYLTGNIAAKYTLRRE